jgi:hypothetical protein
LGGYTPYQAILAIDFLTQPALWVALGRAFRYRCGAWLKFYEKFDVPVWWHTRQVIGKDVWILAHYWNIF